MPLILALKNRSAIVVASDVPEGEAEERFNPLMPLEGGSVLLIAGNLPAVEHTVMQTFLPKLTAEHYAAQAAQLLQAALVVDMVPNLGTLKGRVEFILAGIDPIHHADEPSLYYLDSAQDFYLRVINDDAVAGGTTAAIKSVLAGHSYADASVEQLKVLARECVAATKLRWPGAVAEHIRVGIITPHATRIMDAFPAR